MMKAAILVETSENNTIYTCTHAENKTGGRNALFIIYYYYY